MRYAREGKIAHRLPLLTFAAHSPMGLARSWFLSKRAVPGRSAHI